MSLTEFVQGYRALLSRGTGVPTTYTGSASHVSVVLLGRLPRPLGLGCQPNVLLQCADVPCRTDVLPHPGYFQKTGSTVGLVHVGSHLLLEAKNWAPHIGGHGACTTCHTGCFGKRGGNIHELGRGIGLRRA